MANGDGMLSGLGKGLGSVLSAALPVALGAALGGPMGAAAGFAEEKGAESQYELQRGGRALDWLKLGLEQQKIQSDEDLKKAQQESTEAFRSSTEKYRQMSLDERSDEFKQRLLQHQDDQAFQQDYRQSMLALAQGNQALRAQIAQTGEQTRRDALAQQLRENTRSRIAGAEALAEHASEFAMSHRGFWDKYITRKDLSDDEYKQQVHDLQLADSLKAQGLSRDELLDNGVAPDVVDKIYPSAGGPSAKLTSKTASSASAGLPTEKPPKSMWGKPGKPTVGTIGGKRVSIDEFGRVKAL